MVCRKRAMPSSSMPALPAIAATIALGLALTACSAVGPDYRAPPPPPGRTYTREPQPATTVATRGPFGAAQRFDAANVVEYDWWRNFGSPKLDATVAEAMRNSPTLESATASLDEAREIQAAQSGSTRIPTIGGRLGAAREEINGASVGQPRFPQTTYTLFNASVAVNYTFDLFGGNRRALEALAAQVDYRRFELAGARVTLAGNVVTTALAEAELSAQIDATQSMLARQRRQLEIARRAERLGTGSHAAVLALRTTVEQTGATLPPLRNRLQRTTHQLAVLLGRPPGDAAVPRFAMSDFTLPARLPLVVPSELVRARPDVQASSALLHAATAQYGVAVAALYPQINLSSSLGSAALTTGALFGPGSAVWSLAGSLAQPLFNAGLRSGARAAEASLQAVGANYRQTVLQALRDVADALRQLDADAEVLQRQQAAYSSARRAGALVSRQYGLGVASYVQLLLAEQQIDQIHVGLIAARAARLADSAALYQAMGGGAHP
ncbi:MAG: efflux transporter outer membrane subunit [Gammaproteobacteria bacterium]|nr:efflux transporter outer membrane subunit [Gammaproteobacteria bacterium]